MLLVRIFCCWILYIILDGFITSKTLALSSSKLLLSESPRRTSSSHIYQQQRTQWSYSPSQLAATKQSKPSDATMATALCVIPPDSAWDTIQRARHLARDRSFYIFPPAIRLIHPFCPRHKLSDAALEVARIIEQHHIAPFPILLNQWVIIPHMEALEADWDAMQLIPHEPERQPQPLHNEQENNLNSLIPSDEDVQRLIEHEERQGYQRRKKRLERRRAKIRKIEEDDDDMTIAETYNSATRNSLPDMDRYCDDDNDEYQQSKEPYDEMKEDEDYYSSSPRALLEKQKQMYEEFNGPCVVCLEPDEESRKRLIQLRDLLLSSSNELLGPYDKYSTTSSVSIPMTDQLPRSILSSYNNNDLNDNNSESWSSFSSVDSSSSNYRPLVPIGAFPSVSSALETARKLRGLWDPLCFNVTDLHLISQGSTDIILENTLSEFEEYDNEEDEDDVVSYDPRQRRRKYTTTSTRSTSLSASAPSSIKTTSWIQPDDNEELFNVNMQYGCDAMIRLMGEELPMDNELNAELANLVLQNGVAGGFEASSSSSSSIPCSTDDSSSRRVHDNYDDDNNNNNDYESLDAWLNDDDDWDEGTVVVLGRTHFFTGEMRIYVGMPASSSIDARDKVMGEGISGAARRRSSVHRQQNLWQDGDFGRKDSDFSPWSNREK